MADTELNREEQLITYLVNQCDGRLGRTRLMKLIYLADYETRRFLGRPITSIDYKWHHYGPYDHKLEDRVERLKDMSVITEAEVAYPTGKWGYLYRRGTAPVQYDFSPAEIEVLGYVCKEYSHVDLQELLDDIVYQTEPMLEAKAKNARGESLNMDTVNNQRGKELAVSLDGLLVRRSRVRAGDCLSHAEAMTAMSGSPATEDAPA